jgi:hypothetical protein
MNRATILRAIQEAPPDEQDKLLADLYALVPDWEKPPAVPNSTRPAGLFRNGKEPLSDEHEAQWLDERRWEKAEHNP